MVVIGVIAEITNIIPSKSVMPPKKKDFLYY